MNDDLKSAALHYHEYPNAGKVRIVATKPMTNQRDLALAYSPGVAAPCTEIEHNPTLAASYTSRGNLVAVITNGTAVLGLGNIGPLASKPVMEGKAVLFKHFADVDAFDIEVDETDVDKFIDVVAALEPTFGGINLEDIKAPQCFEIEEKLRERMNIPVFHDDQHGTAIVTAAAVINGLRLQDKKPEQVKLVVSGAGAAAMACTDLIRGLGVKLENILMLDSKGVIHNARKQAPTGNKAVYARDTDARTLDDAIVDADIFLGVSQPGVLTQDMVKKMAPKPIILACANPIPEIMPDLAKEARPDAIIATGRSDFPNQVNNVLCFPFLFRGALDVGATTINEEMKIASVYAIADIAREESSDVVARYYDDESLTFGPDYILPKPFDPRLITEIPTAVAKAAIESGVAERPAEDLEAYRASLSGLVYRSGNIMRPIFAAAKSRPARVVYTDGESERVLRAVKVAMEDGYAIPTVIGNPARIQKCIDMVGLKLKAGDDFEVVDPADKATIDRYSEAFYQKTKRNGVIPRDVERILSAQRTSLAALMVDSDEQQALIAGPSAPLQSHMPYLKEIIGVRDGVDILATMQLLILDGGSYFISDTGMNENPSPEEIAKITLLSAEQVRMFGIDPRVGLISHSNFGSRVTDTAQKMKQALSILQEMDPELIVEGEMQGDVAISSTLRQQVFPDTRYQEAANLLIMPNVDAAHISYTMLKSLANGVCVGPILMGLRKPAHAISSTITSRGIVNLTSVAVAAVNRNNKMAEGS